MFLSLGLFNDTPMRVNKNLLRIKVNVFNVLNELIYGLRMGGIFPSIKSSTIANLSNRFLKTGPVNCAADDLDLSLGGTNDQIEFFNNFIINNIGSVGGLEGAVTMHGYGSGHPSNESGDAGVTRMVGNQYGGYQEDSERYTYGPQAGGQQGAQDFSNNYGDDVGVPMFPVQSIYDFNFNSKYISSAPMVHNYADIPANTDLATADDGSPYFHDFRRTVSQKQPDQAQLYSSSQESYISPVDEEMFRKVHVNQVRKRKFDSVSSSDSNISAIKQEEIMHIDKAPYAVDNMLNSLMMKQSIDQKIVLDHPHAPLGDGLNDFKKYGKRSRKMRLSNVDGSEISYDCPHCDAKFKVKGYLTRHLKKHNSSKAFVCPFFKEPSDGVPGSKCHPTGGFSRRDTYKTHLKALHFIYPPGTKSNERNMISGRCAGCFKHFDNNYKWLENHIESGECNGTVIFNDNKKRSESTLKEI